MSNDEDHDAQEDRRSDDESSEDTSANADEPKEDDDESEDDESGERAAEGSSASRERKKTDDSRRFPWGWLLLAAGVLELYAFGARGEVEVCVAKDGVHDFALLGTPRTDQNRARFPSCETRLNLGVFGDFEKREEEAMYLACRRATILGGKRDTATCAAKIGWSHRSTSQQIWPWDRRFYRQLFWFLFS